MNYNECVTVSNGNKQLQICIYSDFFEANKEYCMKVDDYGITFRRATMDDRKTMKLHKYKNGTVLYTTKKLPLGKHFVTEKTEDTLTIDFTT